MLDPRCRTCGRPITSRIQIQKHHKFPQTKVNKKLYGKMIDDPRNIQSACWNCNVGHNSPHLIHWNEDQFCAALGIEPRSKLSQIRKLRNQQPNLF